MIILSPSYSLSRPFTDQRHTQHLSWPRANEMKYGQGLEALTQLISCSHFHPIDTTWHHLNITWRVRTSWTTLGHHLVSIRWTLGDHLATTWWTLGCHFDNPFLLYNITNLQPHNDCWRSVSVLQSMLDCYCRSVRHVFLSPLPHFFLPSNVSFHTWQISLFACFHPSLGLNDCVRCVSLIDLYSSSPPWEDQFQFSSPLPASWKLPLRLLLERRNDHHSHSKLGPREEKRIKKYHQR